MMVTTIGWKYTIYIISTPKQSKYPINMIPIHKVPEKIFYIESSSKGPKYAFYIALTQKESKYLGNT